jgi:hypothetical protein
MSKVKGYILLAVVLFFIATNPHGAASLATTIGHGFAALVDGFGQMAGDLSGGAQ